MEEVSSRSSTRCRLFSLAPLEAEDREVNVVVGLSPDAEADAAFLLEPRDHNPDVIARWSVEYASSLQRSVREARRP